MAMCPTCRTKYDDSQTQCPEDGAWLLPDVAFAAADRDLKPGDKVGEYAVQAKIGKGGFGSVYKAEQPLIGRKVAIKVLKREFSADPELAARFIDEARAVNQIRHPYIIDIFSFGQLEDGRHYYVMDFLEGQSLEDLLVGGKPPPPETVLPLLRAVAEAVDAAHSKGIAHRDLKPENVFVLENGAIKLLDFGIAKLMSGDRESKTQTGAMMGTPHYMSPEQCRGENVDHRTDIYAFGCMTFRMLTGVLPFKAPDVMMLLYKHFSEEPPLPSEVAPTLPAALDAPILRMMAKSPDDRPPSLAAGIAAVIDAARASGIDVADGLSAARFAAPTGGHAAARPVTGNEPTVAGDFDHGPTLGMQDSAVGAAPVAAGSTSVLLGAETQSAMGESRSGGRVLIGALGAAALAIAIAAFALTRGGGTETAQAGADPAALAQTGESGSDVIADDTDGVDSTDDTDGVDSTDGADGTAPAHDDATANHGDDVKPSPPEPPATITLHVQGVPKGTEVYGPDGLLGVTPNPIELPRGDQPVELELRKSGYVSATQRVTPVANGLVSVSMQRVRRSRPDQTRPSKPKKPSADDIEEAF